MIFERKKPKVRYFAYAILLLLCFLLQVTPGVLELWGVKPILVVPAAVCIAMEEPVLPASVFGMAAGLLLGFYRRDGVWLPRIAVAAVLRGSLTVGHLLFKQALVQPIFALLWSTAAGRRHQNSLFRADLAGTGHLELLDVSASPSSRLYGVLVFSNRVSDPEDFCFLSSFGRFGYTMKKRQTTTRLFLLTCVSVLLLAGIFPGWHIFR